MGPKNNPRAGPKKSTKPPFRKPKPQSQGLTPATVSLSTQQRMLDIFAALLTPVQAPSRLPGNLGHFGSPSTNPDPKSPVLASPSIANQPGSTSSIFESLSLAEESRPSAESRGSALATLRTDIQEVKQHLYNRAFDQAFGSARLLRAYALRWSPTRALAYHELLHTELAEHLSFLHGASRHESSEPVRHKVVCIGAGAGAELIAFTERSADKVSLHLIDISPWSDLLASLEEVLATPRLETSDAMEIDRRRSESPAVSVSFGQQDVLALEPSQIASLVKHAALVTVLFTLNELYATSRAKTTGLLLALSAGLAPGAALLVVDSPGDYSTVDVGSHANQQDAKKEKMYPMRWLLDHTLLQVANMPGKEDQKAQERWVKVYENETRWFRIPQSLKYPLELENMRYQAHLYIRT